MSARPVSERFSSTARWAVGLLMAIVLTLVGVTLGQSQVQEHANQPGHPVLIERHSRDFQRLLFEMAQARAQLDRVEMKVDRLLEGR